MTVPPLAHITVTPPDLMTADERLDEVARILAAGFLRLRQKEAAIAAAKRAPKVPQSQQIQQDNSPGPQRVSSTATGYRSVRGSRLTFRRDR